MTLTCRSTASWRMDGIDWPSAQSPTAIFCLICSMIWRYIGRLSDCEMAKAPLMSIYSVYTDSTACQQPETVAARWYERYESSVVSMRKQKPPLVGKTFRARND